jgi:TetR/AcrR family transcriptional regulator, tetracycline repressor protein
VFGIVLCKTTKVLPDGRSGVAVAQAARRPDGKAERLTENQIVDAALAIIKESGVQALSMRSLSRQLGVSAMAAYYYVNDKQGLLDLVAKRALGEIEIPDRSLGPWYLRLRVVIDQVEAELRRNQGIAEILLGRTMFSQRRVMNAVMEILEDAGFDGPNVINAYALIHTYLFGRYRVVVGQHDMEEARPADSDDPQDDVVNRLSPFTKNLVGRDYYSFGIETLIYGLRSQLRRQDVTDVPD